MLLKLVKTPTEPPETSYDEFIDSCNENEDAILQSIIDCGNAENFDEAEKQFEDWCEIEWLKICDRKAYDPN